MFWDNVAGIYDLVETVYNGKVYRGTGAAAAAALSPEDTVLECACGTGAISVCLAPKCRRLIATDFSAGMCRQAAKKLSKFPNAAVRRADMTHLKCRDDRFDKVVAGNVIHLLDDPEAAVRELMRVCKPGGTVIIPTYINLTDKRQQRAVKLFEFAGARFKRQFDLGSYKAFFRAAGYENVRYHVVEGKMPCAIAFITKS